MNNISKVQGTLHLKFIDGKTLYLENVENFNLINGVYYIWVLYKPCLTFSKKYIQGFYYAYTKY